MPPGCLGAFAALAGVLVAFLALLAFAAAHPVLTTIAFLNAIGVVAALCWHRRDRRRRQAAEQLQAEQRRRLQQAELEHRRQLQRAELAQVDGMSGTEFEHLVAWLLRSTGWRDVAVHGGANDRGADITAIDTAGQLLVVQCKRYADPVGSPHVQRVMGTHRPVHGAHHSWIVTNSVFTPEAHRLAEIGQIRLVDRPGLADWMLDVTASHR